MNPSGFELPPEQAPFPLGFWSQRSRVTPWLLPYGFSPQGAREKADQLAHCVQTLLDHGESPDRPAMMIYCPGRLEVFGKHTDYAGGRSLLGAPEWGITALTVARAGDEVLLHSEQASGPWRTTWSQAGPLPNGWGRYPATVMGRLVRHFPGPWRGLHMAMASDLPLAAGMSSSSALLTTSLIAFAENQQLTRHALWQNNLPDRAAWALFASCVENGQTFGDFLGHTGVGTFGGSEDHVAMLCGLPNRLRQVRFGPLRWERDWTVPKDWTFLVAQSGVAAEKAAGARERYNQLSQTARDLLKVARSMATPLDQAPEQAHEQALDRDLDRAPADRPASLGAFLRSDRDAFERLVTALDPQAPQAPYAPPSDPDASPALRRLWQFHQESECWIPELPDPSAPGSLAVWAETARASTQAADRWLGNQVPQTLWLTQAWLDAGARAASPFGAGFGGSVWALCLRDEVDRVLTKLRTLRAPDEGLAEGLASARPVPLGPSAFWVGSPGFS